VFAVHNQLHYHYLAEHCITGPGLATYPARTCNKCHRSFILAHLLRKRKCAAAQPAVNSPGRGADGWRTIELAPPLPRPPRWTLFTDGSYTKARKVGIASGSDGPARQEQRPEKAGWGAAIYRATFSGEGRQVKHEDGDTEPTYRIYGPVVVDSQDHRYLGAAIKSNNTGELLAIAEVLLWLLDEAPDDRTVPVTIYFDSQYAGNSAQLLQGGTANGALRRQVEELVGRVEQTRTLTWRWVKGHSGTPGNDEADPAADKGANGEVSEQSTR
jgi:ribonuclease HI